MSIQIFISYRRIGGSAYAQSIYERLTNHGYECFYDRETMGSGSFDVTLYDKIEECEDFLLVLPINGLDRCSAPEDWVRKEIEHAIKFNKNIVPIMQQDFEFPNDLPDSLKSLSKKNGIYLNWDFFGEGIEKLERNFLHSKVRYQKPHKKYKIPLIIFVTLILTIVIVFLPNIIRSFVPSYVKYSGQSGDLEIAFRHRDEVSISDTIEKNFLNNFQNVTGYRLPNIYEVDKFEINDNKIEMIDMTTLEENRLFFEDSLREAEHGDSDAMLSVGLCYKFGEGVKQNDSKAFEWIMKSAETNNVRAMQLVGLLYYEGIGVEKNLNEACKWLIKSADLIIDENLVDGDMLLMAGFSYLMGSDLFIESDDFNIAENERKAFETFKRSANLGDTRAIVYLGYCYCLGFGVEQDNEKAFEYFTKATNLGDNKAMLLVGLCYDEGIGVEKNYSKAFEYFNKAMSIRNYSIRADDMYGIDNAQDEDIISWALFCIGDYYANGKGVKQDYKQAFKFFMKSAELGDTEAMANVGLYYWQGKGISQDYEEALNWSLKAAEADNEKAMNNIGKMYYLGEGLQKNYEKAFEWFSKAAEVGDIDAMKNLSIMYRNGNGVSKDENKAKEWEQKYEKLQRS